MADRANTLLNIFNAGAPSQHSDSGADSSYDTFNRNVSPHSQQQQPPGAFPKMQQQPMQQQQPQNISQASASSTTTPVSSISGSNIPSDSRQNALLSLIGSVEHQQGKQQQIQQQSRSSPPLPVHQQHLAAQGNTGLSPNSNEAHGKRLLEQLMSNNPAHSPPHAGANQVPYSGPYNTAQQDPQQPPSPRKSMFDFTSPFDAFSPPSTTSVAPSNKRNLAGQSHSSEEESLSHQHQSGLNTLNVDPKRKSVENLMQTLTAGGQTTNQTHGGFGDVSLGPGRTQGLSSRTTSESKPQPFPQGTVNPPSPPPAVPPLNTLPSGSPSAPQQGNRHTVPRTSSPATVTSHSSLRDNLQQTGRADISSWKSDPKPKLANRQQSVNSQVITFDVSQPLETVQAPLDTSLSTPIALVKVEPTFLPGSTIGATSWIAYAMTRGRVRVISRASGDRTLLQLPATFPSTTSVVDMAVFGNRLAGVTSDGGLVVWELPPVILDDVPGKLLLCVVPPPEPEALKSVRWHPKKPETVAVASESKIYLLSINDAFRKFGNDAVTPADLTQVGPVITLSSPLVAFAFDVPHFAIATISEDSTLELWRISTQLPFWSAKIPGEATPSSIDFLDNGIVIGRKNGTVLQLLSVLSETVLSTVKFIDTQNKDERDMFGHVTYDSRIQTLWVANSRRESLIALKVYFEGAFTSDEPRNGYFEQVTEFVGPKPSIHFVILTSDSDPNGEEAHAACVAAKIAPGPLGLVAFSVHSAGVDQVIIRREWFDGALQNATAKLPPGSHFSQFAGPVRSEPVNFGAAQLPSTVHAVEVHRSDSPESEDGAGTFKEESRPAEPKQKNIKGKAVGFKDDSKEKLKEKATPKTSEELGGELINGAFSKDLRKLEDSIQSRVGKLVTKELDKQLQKLEEMRAADQSAEVVRQEKILKLISTELTRNTTRVVEMAVKSEVQSSVLPSLENIARNEIKSGLSNQIAKGLGDSIKQTLPNEIERLLLRQDISNHIARAFSTAVSPIIERHVKEASSKTLLPAYSNEIKAMYQDISRDIRTEMANLKKEMVSWQNETLRGQEAVIRDLEQSIRSLQDQIKFTSLNLSNANQSISAMHPHRNSPVLASPHMQPHVRSNYASSQSGYTQPTPVNTGWFGPPNITSHSHATLMQPVMAASQGNSQTSLPSMSSSGSHPDAKGEDWDETYLAVLGSQDPRQLRDLLARSNPESVMPLNGNGPLSQAVVLTLVHRLSAAVGETSPVDEAFKSALWWLQRAANTLNTQDPLISPYVGRVLPNVQAMLNTTKSRLSLLPGGPPLMEANRVISEVQDIVGRKSG